MLTLSNISLNRAGRAIFSDVGITFGAGIFTIKGENGSGKTTLLEIIAGILEPSSGSIELEEGESLSYIPHVPCVKPEVSVYDNISHWANLSGNQILIPTAISYFELESYIDIECRKLSAGLMKRVDLARLIVENNKIWLLDEPSINLDSKITEKLRNLIATRADQQGTIIVATHDNDFLKVATEIGINDFSRDS